MGVTGLWRLIDASGKPVPLETLEGKVLAIDISIWIHQVLQGYQDHRGNAVPNAHLLGLFSRICKLLYFKIKPIFVFDGGVPLLKKNTIAARKKQKAIAAGKVEYMKKDLLHNLLKYSVVKGVLANKAGEGVEVSASTSQKSSDQVNDMYRLPLLPSTLTNDSDSYESDSYIELSPCKQGKWKGDIHTVDVSSDDFKVLPADVRYDILTDLKETRKQNSWGRLHEIPQETHQFSNYQMQRLLKRRKVQESLEIAEQEMGGKNFTLEELEKLMVDQGVDVHRDTMFRIAADSTTRLIYVNDLKALKSTSETSESSHEDSNKPGCSKTKFTGILSPVMEESEIVVENINEYDLDDEWDSDIEVINQAFDSHEAKKFFDMTKINPALSYMLEHSGLSQEQILILIEQSRENVSNANKNFKKFKRTQSNLDDNVITNEKQSRKNMNYSVTSSENLITMKKEPKVKISSSSEKSRVFSSDSDSDDFLEVSDVPISHTSIKNEIPIIIKPEEILNNEDDIFADIFEEESPIHNTSLNSLSSKDQSSQNLSIDNINEIEINPIINQSNAIIDIRESSTPIEKKSVEDSFLQSENSLVNIHEKSLEPPVNLIRIETDISDHLLTQNCEENTEVHAENISNASREHIILLTEKDDNVEQKKSTQLTTDEIAVIMNRGVSEKVDNMIDQWHNDKECILANINKSEELSKMKYQLENENQKLKNHIGKLERQATEVTEQMRSDAQDLLRLFGIPYVVAPQEAEAQCAYLEMINLTDGTITDDSDIWLFGGQCVYKNFFNNAKRVMEYRSKDIEHHFKLTREQMIQLALLVGSDYTAGINGIGPVTALEILACFPTEGNDLLRGLTKFSSWMKAGRQMAPGRATLRNKLKNIVVDQGFPSQAVVQAYLFPTVDENKEKFSWGKPDLVLLFDYTKEKFGWNKLKFEETIGPVMKRYSDKTTQKTIMSYFKVHTVPQSIDQNLSKRVQEAVKMMDRQYGNDSDNEVILKNTKKVEIKEPRNTTGRRRKGKSDDNEDAKQQTTEMNILDKGLTIIAMQDRKYKAEYIPQREKERAAALKKKMQAIKVFKKSRNALGRSGKKNIRPARKIVRKEAKLSESNSDDTN